MSLGTSLALVQAFFDINFNSLWIFQRSDELTLDELLPHVMFSYKASMTPSPDICLETNIS
jgi:hypothetical protein